MKERTPYKYLDYYTFEDADLFFGREEETQKMVGEILSTKLLVLFSPSGSGKTSLIHAGVRPALEKLGYRTIYTRFDGPDPISSVRNAVANALNLPATNSNDDLHGFLANALHQQNPASSIQHPETNDDPRSTIHEQPVVLFLDQFEEFFLVFDKQPEARKAFIEQVAKIKYDDQLPVFLVFSLREDYFANLHEFREAIPSIFQNNANLRLEPFTEEEAARAIAAPVKQFGYEYDESLVQTLVADLKNGKAGIEPIALQIVCHTLWRNRPRVALRSGGVPSIGITPKIDEAIYRKCHGAQAIIDEHVNWLLRQIPQREQGFMVRIFEALKTRDNTKLYRRAQDLQETLRMSKGNRLQSALQKLAEIGVLRHEQRSGDDWYEFKHDYLVPEVTKWIQARRERSNRRRLWYVAAPGVVLLCSVLFYLFVQYNSFYAGTLTPENVDIQEEEIAIFRDNPFHQLVVTTGYLLSDMRDDSTRRIFKNHLNLGFGKSKDWTWLENRLGKVKAGTILYQRGNMRIALDTLVAALEDEDYEIREHAAIALGKIGQNNDRIISALLAALEEDDDTDVRMQAAIALGNIGESDDRVISALLRALKYFSSDVREQAAVALGKIGQSSDRVVSALLAALKDEDSDVREGAAAALGKIGKSDGRLISALLAVLEDYSPDVLAQAATALASIGKSHDRVVSALLAALKNYTTDGRARATTTLITIGKSDSRVISTLLAVLKDEDWGVPAQTAVAQVMVNLNKTDDQVVSTLFAGFKDDYSGLRMEAATALGKIGKSDDRVISTLLSGLKDQFEDVRSQATIALINLARSDDHVISALLPALDDEDSYVRAHAAVALGFIGKSDGRVISALLAALKISYGDLRSQTLAALVNIGKSDHRVTSALLAALKDYHPGVRVQAAIGLGKLFQIKRDDELIALLTNNLSGYRIAAGQALGRRDSLSPMLLKRIDQLRKDDRPWVCYAAWDTYELIQNRLKNENKANQLLQRADSLLTVDQLPEAIVQYEKAFDILREVIRVDSTKTARAKFQQARCAAKLKRAGLALDDLEIAFAYHTALRAEMSQPENDWKILEGNWYLRDVLLKKE